MDSEDAQSPKKETKEKGYNLKCFIMKLSSAATEYVVVELSFYSEVSLMRLLNDKPLLNPYIEHRLFDVSLNRLSTCLTAIFKYYRG